MKEHDEDKKEAPLTTWEEDLCELVLSEWEKGRSYVSDLDDLYETLYKMLRGERPEKNYDWQSNLVINKVFQVVWSAIPYITQKVFGAVPLMGVKSVDKRGASQRENILEYWHHLQPGSDSPYTPFFLILVMWTLRAMLNGVGILKKTWHQKLKTTTKEIQQTIPMKMDEAGNVLESEPHTKKVSVSVPVEDWPYNVIVNNKDIVFDWLLQPTQSIRQGRFITHRSMLDLDSLKSSKINYINLDQIETTINTTNSTLRQDHAGLKDMDGQGEPPDSDIYTEIETYERQGKLPVYKDGGEWKLDLDHANDKTKMKEMVITVAKMSGTDDHKDVLLRFEPNPYGEKGYIDIHLYFDAERWNSMGLAEPIMDMQTGINDNINAMFDEIWQNLMPPVVVNKFALWDWDTMQYAPQQRWLVGGNPAESIYWKEPSNITRDAWQKHNLLDSEIQLSAVTNAMHGAAKEKTATTNVMNAQMTQGKLDFLVKMVETTGLIPSAQMDVRFAKKFAHRLTFATILGEPFRYSEWEEIYKYQPAASSVKLEHQKQAEIQEDIQLIQILASVPNPNTPMMLNHFLANIMRNRNEPKLANMLDEEYFEPQSDTGELQMMKKRMAGATPQNEQGLPMSGQEKGVRGGTFG